MADSLKSCALGCLATVLALVLFGQWGPAQEAKVPAVQKREYYQVSNPGPKVLISIGNEGWDLVAVTGTSVDGVVTYYFQRLK